MSLVQPIQEVTILLFVERITVRPTNCSWIVLPAACLIVVAVGIALLAATSLVSTTTDEEQRDSSGGGGDESGVQSRPGGGSVYARITTTRSTKAPTTTSTGVTKPYEVMSPTTEPVPTRPPVILPTEATTNATPSATTEPPTTGPTTTTQVPLKPGSLLCTIAQGFTRSTYEFPPDGLCAIIIFDSLYRRQASLRPPYQEDFEYFLDTAQRYDQSEFGIGIYQNVTLNATAVEDLVSDSSTKTHLEELWNDYRIYHYAHINENMHFPGYHSAYVVNAANGLQGNAFAYLGSDSDIWPARIQRVIGVGMGGRWYTPCTVGGTAGNRQANYSIGSKCGYTCKKYKVKKEDQITNIASVCKRTAYNSSFHVDATFESLIALNDNDELLYIYDTPSNFRSKLCKAKKLSTNVTNIMAAVDIQYEDYEGTCGYGAYPRLYMLKKLSLFFSLSYKSPSKEAECMAIT
ncbi:hypothetical protein HPB50_023808 [Hyalomma asiaticum]|uniref:Uncharacterized protein n=1 Tax=Hyalomma asiaticum TaxID=266040 RepID=A0ACB7SS34_HYAAI|nr:hypothetical protein HPB50_023808 [Hyalomma asiaticum]